jgi:hypothetical protein
MGLRRGAAVLAGICLTFGAPSAQAQAGPDTVRKPPARQDTLRKPQPLPTVPVTTPASRGPRFADFERRQKTGRGQYLTKEQIARGGMNSLHEALRTLRGVNVECGGGGGCFVHMARAPMRCLPEWIIDDRVDSFFGPRTPLQDVEALEVYSGPSDVPGEFAGRNAGCGVIVVWTKSGPPRRKP